MEKHSNGNGKVGSIESFTAREHEVVALMNQGKGDRDIGMILDISPRTVRFHVNNAKAKLRVFDRVPLGIQYDRQNRDTSKPKADDLSIYPGLELVAE